MIKKVFTFTVKGNKKEFNSMKELVNARHELQANGMDVDAHSIKIEEVKVKATASIEFDSCTFEEIGRTLTAYVTVKSEEAEMVFDALACIMSLSWDVPLRRRVIIPMVLYSIMNMGQ